MKRTNNEVLIFKNRYNRRARKMVKMTPFCTWLKRQFHDFNSAVRWYVKFVHLDGQKTPYGMFSMRSMCAHISNVLEGKEEESDCICTNYTATKFGLDIYWADSNVKHLKERSIQDLQSPRKHMCSSFATKGATDITAAWNIIDELPDYLRELFTASAEEANATKEAEEVAPIVGTEEGDFCNRDGCLGVLELTESENCTCHLSPPCDSCMAIHPYCPECDWE
jgi:hypothetical protein